MQPRGDYIHVPSAMRLGLNTRTRSTVTNIYLLKLRRRLIILLLNLLRKIKVF
jgi:hypothetical protein